MRIRHESRRVRLNHANMKSLTRILSINHDSRGERTLKTSRTVPQRHIITNLLRVGERDPRRPRRALCRLVNMRRGGGRGIEFALEVVEGDVVADHVGRTVDAEMELTRSAGDAAGGFSAVDDFFGDGIDGLHGREGEELVGVEGVCGDSGVHVEADLDGDDTIRCSCDGSGRCAER